MNLERATESDELTIASGDDTSDIFDMRPFTFGCLFTPSALDGSIFTFNVAADSDGPFVPMNDSAGNATSLTVDVDQAYDLPAELAGAHYFTITSDSTETAERVFMLVLKG